MPASLFNVAIDCADPYQLARFWSEVTGRAIYADCQPGDPEVAIELDDRLNLYFQQVPESKQGKNRIHVCLRPDQVREAEVARLTGLGATVLADHRKPGGRGWIVLADPEGNEFCILRHDIG